MRRAVGIRRFWKSFEILKVQRILFLTLRCQTWDHGQMEKIHGQEQNPNDIRVPMDRPKDDYIFDYHLPYLRGIGIPLKESTTKI